MSITLYEYPTCSTCRKARTWLNNAGVAFTSVHLVESTPDAATLADLHARSKAPIKKLFNTSGRSYRSGQWKDKLPTLTNAQAYQALAVDGMLIKRPILDLGEGQGVLIGFKEATYQEALGA